MDSAHQAHPPAPALAQPIIMPRVKHEHMGPAPEMVEVWLTCPVEDRPLVQQPWSRRTAFAAAAAAAATAAAAAAVATVAATAAAAVAAVAGCRGAVVVDGGGVGFSGIGAAHGGCVEAEGCGRAAGELRNEALRASQQNVAVEVERRGHVGVEEGSAEARFVVKRMHSVGRLYSQKIQRWPSLQDAATSQCMRSGLHALPLLHPSAR